MPAPVIQGGLPTLTNSISQQSYIDPDAGKNSLNTAVKILEVIEINSKTESDVSMTIDVDNYLVEKAAME